jgi:hypothetical protein
MADSVTIPCSCCDKAPICSGPISGTNVFAITREEYLRYHKGGVWSINASINQFESWQGGSVSGSSSGSVSRSASGCIHQVQSTFTHTTTGGVFDEIYGIDLQLGIAGVEGERQYYAKICAFLSVHMKCGDEPGTGYGTPTATVDGNPIAVHVIWQPSAAGNSGYSNSTTSNLNAVFSPSPV